MLEQHSEQKGGSSLHSRLLLGHQTFPPTTQRPQVLAKGTQGWSWWSLRASFFAACAFAGLWNCVTINPLNIAAGVWMM